MSATDYDPIGDEYTTTREPDDRIGALIRGTEFA